MARDRDAREEQRGERAERGRSAAPAGASGARTTVDRILAMQRGAGNRATGAALARRLDEDSERAMSAAFGVDMSPVRVVRDSGLPVGLGAQAVARGTEVHMAPGAPGRGTDGERRLLAHELAHVVQQSEGRVRPTASVGDLEVSTDRGLEQDADAAAERVMRGEPAGAGEIAGLAGPPGPPVAQPWPPKDLDDAIRERTQLERELFGRGVTVTWAVRQGRSADSGAATEHSIVLTNPSASGMRAGLVEARRVGAVVNPSSAWPLIDLWLRLKAWEDANTARQGGFGYSAVPSHHYPPPSPLQTTFGFNPSAPHLTGQPFTSLTPDQTLEQVGDDIMVRDLSEEELERRRAASNAYGGPPQTFKQHTKPTFRPDIYSGESTILDSKRAGTWATQKRGQTATAGILGGTGEKWGDQKAKLGMSAYEAVRGYNNSGQGKQRDPELPYQWLHLFAFSIGGRDAWNPQDVRNFILGTEHANYYHQIFERIAKNLARKHQVEVSCEAVGAISPDWRVYTTLRYRFLLRGVIRFPLPMVFREIPCFGTPQVHASDAAAVEESILVELGLASQSYNEAAADALRPRGPEQRLTPLSGEHAMEVQETEDEQVERVLRVGVQQIAQEHGVLRDFEVGHADGSDHNCSILSVFAAAGVDLTREEAEAYRAEIVTAVGHTISGDIDLDTPTRSRDDPTVAHLLLRYLSRRGRDCALYVLEADGPGRYRRTLRTGRGQEIHIFFAGAHFSPARRRR
jgi:hypothetical protein